VEPNPIRFRELASRLGRPWEGDGDVWIRGVASLEEAGPEDLAFARSPRFAEALARSRAGGVVVSEGLEVGGRPLIRSPNPGLDFARAVRIVLPRVPPEPGVHPSAWVAPDAQLDPGASVGPFCVVGARSRIGPGSVLRAHVTLYEDVRIGADCELHAGVVLCEGTGLGDRVVLQPGVVLGADGFGYLRDEQGRAQAVPHVGRVVIEDDVEIGVHSVVDRSTLGETRIRRGAKIDNLVCIAHNCDVGEDVFIVAQSGLAGSTIVERGAILMAQVGASGHLTIGKNAFVGARGGVHKDVPPGVRVWGTPQMEERRWHRAMAALARLPDALRRLRAVERRLGLRGGKPEAEEE
jgi:UDP-3-O-[3-hydroxymyristoyl] glucosamine N-acyltransferase